MKLLKKIFLENLLLKLISIIFAVSIFIIVHINLSQQITQTIKINPSFSIPKGLVMTNNVSEISLIVQAPKKLINKISKEGIPLIVEAPKSQRIEISKKMFPQLEGANLIKVVPEYIDVVIEKYETKSVPIVLNITRQLPKGYIYDKFPNLDKKEITISGPQSILKSYTQVYTQALNQEEILGTNFKILNFKNSNNFIKIEENNVKVNFSIKEKIVKKEFKDLKIIFINCDMEQNNLEAMKKTMDLLVEFPYSLYDKITKKDFSVYADLKNCKRIKDFQEIQLIITSHYQQTKIKYSTPDSIIVKKIK